MDSTNQILSVLKNEQELDALMTKYDVAKKEGFRLNSDDQSRLLALLLQRELLGVINAR